MPKAKTKQKVNKNSQFLDHTLKILDVFKQNPAVAYTAQQLFTALQLKNKKERTTIKEVLQQLLTVGTIQKIGKGRYCYTAGATYLVGQVDYVRAEYAYVIPDQTQGEQPLSQNTLGRKDVLVFQRNLMTALHKDRVRVKLLPSKRNKHLEGVVVEILERNTAPMIGLVTALGSRPKAIVEQKQGSYEVWLQRANKNELKLNDKVIILLTTPASTAKTLMGKVVENLGQAGTHEVEMHAIMAEFDLKEHFSEELLKSIQGISTKIIEQDIASRKDLRSLSTFTIDPVDAQDFDDALSYQKLENGLHQVGVHIADVSHYVLPDTLLDQEAYLRNTSIYLVDRCIPMLPELLANDLCSLRPHEDRLTFSVIFELDEAGNVHHRWFGETVIHSAKRFSYEEAQAILDAKEGPFYEALCVLNHLAKQLRTTRTKQGAINFDTRELLFQLDENKKPLQVVPKIREDTHKLIEEFMLLANKEVATYVARLKAKKEVVPPTFIYRTHDDPDPEKLDDFFLFVKQLGYTIQRGKEPVFKTMQSLERLIQGAKEEYLIQSLAIRSMAKAIYTTEAKPHFALAFRHYSHFTSPIRRYPDLLVHRLLKKYLAGIKTYDDAAYEKKCQYAVERERIAMQAERASIKYKQVEFIQNLGDQILQGVISGITEWNMYVEITANGCEGMVRLSDLTDDFYVLEENKFQVTGKHSKKSYRIGDAVHVQVKSCSLNKRIINFRLV